MRKKSRYCGAVVGAALAAIIMATPAAAEVESGFTPVIKGVKPLEVGTQAPAFIVKDLEGNVYDFGAEQKKRAHVLVFWSIFCEPCREEMPVIERLSGAYEGGNVEFLAVNLDGTPFLDGIKSFVGQYHYTFRILLDELVGEQLKIADPYQVAGTPALYLVDDTGRIRGSHIGRIGEADLKVMIAGLLGGK